MSYNIEKKIDKIILLVMVIFMVIPSSKEILNISIFKVQTIILFAIFIYLFFTKKINIKEIINNKFILCNILFACSISLTIIANYKTVLLNDLYEIIKYIIYPIVTLIIMFTCKQSEHYNFLLKTISITMIVICIWGIIQYFNPFSINELYIESYAPTQYKTLINNYPTPRIVGVKTNPAVYGLLVAMGIYFNILYYNNAKHKILPIISTILCFINLMMTLTRTIQIAFIFSIIVFILLNNLQKKGWKKALKYTLMVIITIIILIIILPDGLTWRLKQSLDFLNTSSWIARLEKWGTYFNIIKSNPLLGMGPVKNHIQQLGYIDSELIQNILQYGIIGTVMYFSVLLAPLYIWYKNKKNNSNIINYYVPVLVMILLNNISASSLVLFDTACAIYVFIGVIFVNNRRLV